MAYPSIYTVFRARYRLTPQIHSYIRFLKSEVFCQLIMTVHFSCKDCHCLTKSKMQDISGVKRSRARKYPAVLLSLLFLSDPLFNYKDHFLFSRKDCLTLTKSKMQDISGVKRSRARKYPAFLLSKYIPY